MNPYDELNEHLDPTANAQVVAPVARETPQMSLFLASLICIGLVALFSTALARQYSGALRDMPLAMIYCLAFPGILGAIFLAWRVRRNTWWLYGLIYSIVTPVAYMSIALRYTPVPNDIPIEVYYFIRTIEAIVWQACSTPLILVTMLTTRFFLKPATINYSTQREQPKPLVKEPLDQLESQGIKWLAIVLSVCVTILAAIAATVVFSEPHADARFMLFRFLNNYGYISWVLGAIFLAWRVRSKWVIHGVIYSVIPPTISLIILASQTTAILRMLSSAPITFGKSLAATLLSMIFTRFLLGLKLKD